MNKVLTVMLVAILSLLGGCVTSPIPPGYTGPTATNVDDSTMETKFRATYFFVSEINGNRVENNLSVFRAANRGRGFSN